MKENKTAFSFGDLNKEDQELLERVMENCEEYLELREELSRSLSEKLKIINREYKDSKIESVTPEYKKAYGCFIYMQVAIKDGEEKIVRRSTKALRAIESNIAATDVTICQEGE